jgi:hypothetical protein
MKVQHGVYEMDHAVHKEPSQALLTFIKPEDGAQCSIFSNLWLILHSSSQCSNYWAIISADAIDSALLHH